MSAGLPLPTQVVSHGFWLKDQRKMSKSVGNVVRPDALVDAFGVDALRWHLISEMSFGQDASFSDEAFLVRYNSDLANGLGNTLSRAVRMASDAFGGTTPSERCDDNEVKRVAEAAVATWDAAFRGCRLHEAAEAIRTLLGAIDGYITAKEPWKRVKAEGVTPALHRIHYNALEGLRIAAVMLAPIAPGASAEVLRRLGAPKAAEELGPADLAWGGLPLGAPLAPAAPLFPRADAKAYFAEQAKETPVTEETKPVADRRAPAAAVPRPPRSGAPVAAPAAPAVAPGRCPGAASPPESPIDEFFKADLRVAEIIAAEKVEKSKKLMKMRVRIGEEERTIVAGIATAYTAEQLVGRKVVVVANLAARQADGDRVERHGPRRLAPGDRRAVAPRGRPVGPVRDEGEVPCRRDRGGRGPSGRIPRRGRTSRRSSPRRARSARTRTSPGSRRDELRGVRLQLELQRAETILRRGGDHRSTIVVFGGTRVVERPEAERRLAEAEAKAAARPRRRRGAARRRSRPARPRQVALLRRGARVRAASSPPPASRTAAATSSSSTGGGPGVMEAANRGAFDVGAKSLGFNIVLPHEQVPNPYITPGLCIHFHYFALRKMHFLMRAKALVAFPGGFGTLDELFETLTLIQTGKMEPVPIVLFGREFWEKAIDLAVPRRGGDDRAARPRPRLVRRDGGRGVGGDRAVPRSEVTPDPVRRRRPASSDPPAGYPSLGARAGPRCSGGASRSGRRPGCPGGGMVEARVFTPVGLEALDGDGRARRPRRSGARSLRKPPRPALIPTLVLLAGELRQSRGMGGRLPEERLLPGASLASSPWRRSRGSPIRRAMVIRLSQLLLAVAASAALWRQPGRRSCTSPGDPDGSP